MTSTQDQDSSDVLKAQVHHVLQEVKDPELPSISIVELGMLESISIDGYDVTINLLPTFSGCPALDLIEKDVRKAISDIENIGKTTISFIFNPPWTTDRISPEGREKLKEYGVSPPPAHHIEGEPWKIDCPYCGSTYVTMENIFGPTACRSILYCKSCKNPFEAMKPVATLN
ncbi:ring-1,2-phenylacetyl-CoA epoxidase subunit PaaD [Scopulibacillus darangshiensis]|uniref:Ring-1,2-phenylacetyl-CoA epoxidase subunit PaaD n=1 Tax=Scopulibacillus darangshiensis TaxID=442528 RepID=A0A4R2P3J3_9BACL|nr:1,2-phenylacetyl-CoA epoxidase subunit PaaD [Scopulibacillus darangshiensis]TCP29252.1 ring-1,2-phenylacetyl-CoA epoxidase subunit PaaD [Scopulibacillus darangshiensis]